MATCSSTARVLLAFFAVAPLATQAADRPLSSCFRSGPISTRQPTALGEDGARFLWPEAARRSMDELMQTGSFSQAGWSNRTELVERAQKSATAKHVSAKWTRYLRQQQRRRLVGGPGSSRLH